ncbi:unnamed protein product [Nezara viridula]|uniref:Uncharacterized protein n=1 Tax=Nezara viridula TaxID=85310 RepID=A0A9P0E462_NEZVI|nr:unnamed protein product [Nezara viridula]
MVDAGFKGRSEKEETPLGKLPGREESGKMNEEIENCQEINEDSVELQQGEDDTILKEEIWYALGRMKLGKAAGHNGITPDMLRYMGERGIRWRMNGDWTQPLSRLRPNWKIGGSYALPSNANGGPPSLLHHLPLH